MGIKRDKYDVIFSDLVRIRANWTCEMCSKEYPDPSTRGGLHCSHFYGRRHQATRYHPDNAFSLCFGCHRKVEEDPPLHKEWAQNQLGEGRYNLLAERKNSIKKWLKGEKDDMQKFYKEQFKKIKECRDNGECGRIEFIGWE